MYIVMSDSDDSLLLDVYNEEDVVVRSPPPSSWWSVFRIMAVTLLVVVVIWFACVGVEAAFATEHCLYSSPRLLSITRTLLQLHPHPEDCVSVFLSHIDA